MATKKDYEATAAIIRKRVDISTRFQLYFEQRIMDRMAQEFADYFEQDNEKFDRNKFLRAAGVKE